MNLQARNTFQGELLDEWEIDVIGSFEQLEAIKNVDYFFHNKMRVVAETSNNSGKTLHIAVTSKSIFWVKAFVRKKTGEIILLETKLES